MMIGPMLAAAFTLFSPQFGSGTRLGIAQVWHRDGCDGANHSPALNWTNAPAGAKSFALSMYDPDAGPSGWWHWIVVNIPASHHSLAGGLAPSAPALTQGLNDFGVAGYGGPCPPPGSPHHYIFTLYALDVSKLNAPSPLRGTQFRALIDHHVLARTTLTGLYGR